MAIVNDLIKEKAQEAIDAVARRVRVRAGYLFGSHVDGAADELSDIDVAAFVEDAERLDLQQRVRIGVEVRKHSGDEVEIHFFPAEFLDHPPIASFAAYVLEHGVRL
ncbi:MAG: nucleotidyltransferase domain-containing protein [Thermoguttaceae bacterium]|jgi:predicted nucleotidyltransferase